MTKVSALMLSNQEPPRWLVGWNNDNGEFVTAHRELFATENAAQVFYDDLGKQGDFARWKRPYCPGDEEFLSACHSRLVKSLRENTKRLNEIMSSNEDE